MLWREKALKSFSFFLSTPGLYQTLETPNTDCMESGQAGREGGRGGGRKAWITSKLNKLFQDIPTIFISFFGILCPHVSVWNHICFMFLVNVMKPFKIYTPGFVTTDQNSALTHARRLRSARRGSQKAVTSSVPACSPCLLSFASSRKTTKLLRAHFFFLIQLKVSVLCEKEGTLTS